MFKRLTVALALAGIIFAIYVVATAKQPIPSPPPSYPPSVNPFPRGIVALGLIEAGSREIAIAPPEPGRVQQVHVEVGAVVKPGDPLFTLDTAALDAEILQAIGLRDAAAAEVAREMARPRPEDGPPLRAAVAESQARLDDAADRLQTFEQAAERNAVNPDELSRQRFLVSILRSALARDQAALDKYLAGAWKPDVAVAQANLEAREADIASIRRRLDRLIIRAPVDATVLKRDIEPGEYSQPGTGTPAMVLGDLRTLRVRAQVDEEDTPMLVRNAAAVGRIRGPYRTELKLTMLAVEPLARPKQQITNAATELIDTRVVDVLFQVTPQDGITLYPGQVLDVFIDAGDAPEADDSTTPAVTPRRS